jgi:hypothetical protein
LHLKSNNKKILFFRTGFIKIMMKVKESKQMVFSGGKCKEEENNKNDEGST